MIRRTKGQAELIEDVIKAEAVGSHFLCCLVLFGAVWCYLVLKFILFFDITTRAPSTEDQGLDTIADLSLHPRGLVFDI